MPNPGNDEAVPALTELGLVRQDLVGEVPRQEQHVNWA